MLPNPPRYGSDVAGSGQIRELCCRSRKRPDLAAMKSADIFQLSSTYPMSDWLEGVSRSHLVSTITAQLASGNDEESNLARLLLAMNQLIGNLTEGGGAVALKEFDQFLKANEQQFGGRAIDLANFNFACIFLRFLVNTRKQKPSSNAEVVSAPAQVQNDIRSRDAISQGQSRTGEHVVYQDDHGKFEKHTEMEQKRQREPDSRLSELMSDMGLTTRDSPSVLKALKNDAISSSADDFDEWKDEDVPVTAPTPAQPAPASAPIVQSAPMNAERTPNDKQPTIREQSANAFFSAPAPPPTKAFEQPATPVGRSPADDFDEWVNGSPLNQEEVPLPRHTPAPATPAPAFEHSRPAVQQGMPEPKPFVPTQSFVQTQPKYTADDFDEWKEEDIPQKAPEQPARAAFAQSATPAPMMVHQNAPVKTAQPPMMQAAPATFAQPSFPQQQQPDISAWTVAQKPTEQEPSKAYIPKEISETPVNEKFTHIEPKAEEEELEDDDDGWGEHVTTQSNFGMQDISAVLAASGGGPRGGGYGGGYGGARGGGPRGGYAGGDSRGRGRGRY